MHVMVVDIHVKPEHIEAFIEATIENATSSVQEPGVVRFDFIQHADNPANFVLYEIYHVPEDVERHRQTAHYLTWRERVADMMAEPRVGTRYRNIYPRDESWA